MKEQHNPQSVGQNEEGRVFATPTTTEEADLQLPTLAKLLGEPMSEQDIIKRGTLLQKAKLYFAKMDYEDYFDADEKDASRTKIRESLTQSIKTDKDKAIIKQCYIEYQALKEYGAQLRYFYKRFQTAFAVLAKYLNEWSSYEEEAKRLTQFYKTWKERDPKIAMTIKHDFLTLSIEDRDKWEGTCLRFDDKTESFFVDVELQEGLLREKDLANMEIKYSKRFTARLKQCDRQERSLYSHIEEEAASTAETLSDFKAYTVVVEDFLRERSVLRYMPISMQVTIENAEEERYTRYLVKDLSFFKSELNLRRANGKRATKEQRKRAVIPDYYEVKPTPEVKADCQIGLNSYLTEEN